jgi:putative transposase
VKAARRRPGTTGHLEEVFCDVARRTLPVVARRRSTAAELDILLQKRRDKVAAKRFFKRVLASCAEAPRNIVTDQLRSYPAAKAVIPALAHVMHVFVKASARVNNRAGNSHQPRANASDACVASAIPNAPSFPIELRIDIRQHFALKRHLLRASQLASFH